LVEWLRCFKTGETHGRQLLTWFLLSCPAVLVNPYGYHLWLFFVQSLGAPRAISEWGPVPLWSGQYWQFKLMILLFLASFALPTRKRIWEIVIIVFAAVYGFKHQRHTVLTAIVLIPYLLHQWSQWAGQWDLRRGYDRLSHHFQWAVQGVLGLFILASAYNPLNDYAINNFRIRVDPQMYPKYAAQFMALNRINGNLVVPFDWGEYMIWKFPDSRVSIDGRFRTAYPEAIIQMNQDFARGKPEGLKLLTGYPSFLVLTKKGEAPHRFMENLQGWTRIYQDPVSKIFIRDQQQMPDHPVWQHLKAHGIRHTNAPPPWDFPG
ncbi:MAG: hypothetical protein GWM98_14790, partial [Nitrospinaceae bacterium]|nr:hypothetical protein [Nitrospinaceae bacterium]NIR55514.1 hypothetical protein [Nitrospinaceae bacterium]NIS87295.1 hypothetical protein [Nitrospinaceae bacterium]NIT82794.1 hypothetical protein [Nitrospinaceae bacterium]NIU46335.1 hypothetical protein [Nitrospinaceae bacterium]